MYESILCHFIGHPSLQVTIKSVCLTLEAGVGHRTIPMLLAKSSFHGEVTNWSTLINLHSELNLEVMHISTIFIEYEINLILGPYPNPSINVSL